MSETDDAQNLFDLEIEDLREQVLDVIRDADAESAAASGNLKGIYPTADYLRKKIESLGSSVKQYICVNLQYCERVESQQVKLAVDIANAITQAKITLLTGLPLPALKIAVYIIRTRLLDPLCECGAQT